MQTFQYSPGDSLSPPPAPTTPSKAVLRVFPLAQSAGDAKWRIEPPQDPASAILELSAHLPEDKEAVLIGRGDGMAEVIVGPRSIVNQKHTTPILLAIATVCSVIVMMAWGGPQDLWHWDWLYALPGALGIVAILFAHEMGHHMAARRSGMKVTYPYLIPFPLWWGGTFGGYVISETPNNRRASLHLAAGGPLLGLLVTIPIAIVGLWLSDRGALEYRTFVFEDGGFLWNLLVALIGPAGEGYLLLHPLAVAGYFGIFLTGLNLLPVFPLDGGRWVFTFIPPWLRRPFSIAAIIGFFILTLTLGRVDGFLIGLSLSSLRYVNNGIATNDITPLPLPLAILSFLLWLGLFIVLWDINPFEQAAFQFPT